MISRSFMEMDGDAEGAPSGAVTRARGCALVGAASAGAQAEPPDAARTLGRCLARPRSVALHWCVLDAFFKPL